MWMICGKAAEVFNDLYYRYYLQYFKVDRLADDIVWPGGGAGFFAKTVLYPLKRQEEGLKAAGSVFAHTLGRIMKGISIIRTLSFL